MSNAIWRGQIKPGLTNKTSVGYQSTVSMADKPTTWGKPKADMALKGSKPPHDRPSKLWV